MPDEELPNRLLPNGCFFLRYHGYTLLIDPEVAMKKIKKTGGNVEQFIMEVCNVACAGGGIIMDTAGRADDVETLRACVCDV
jgi:hypothetical protein